MCSFPSDNALFFYGRYDGASGGSGREVCSAVVKVYNPPAHIQEICFAVGYCSAAPNVRRGK